jgi:hypothetical protein
MSVFFFFLLIYSSLSISEELIKDMPQVKRGLQMLLPQSWPAYIVAVIGEFTEAADTSLLCKMIRLNIRGVPHDAYVIGESNRTITVFLSNGSVLKVPREEAPGCHVWPVEPDTNPHCMASINPLWLTVICESDRVPPVASFDVYRNAEPHFSNSGFQPCRRLHRRVRTFTHGESPDRVLRPPFILYLKLYFPLMDLMGFQRRGSGWMREAAAYQLLLPRCSPAVAPVCFYAQVHEERGTSAVVMQDLTAFSASAADLHHEACPDEQNVQHCNRALDQLAVLHGKFRAMTRTERRAAVREAEQRMYMQGRGGQAQPRVDPLSSELLTAMIEPKLFSTFWEEVLVHAKAESSAERTRASRILRRVYDCFPAPQPNEEEETAEDREARLADEALGIDFSSLTLIHGNLQLDHLRMTHDARQSPNCFLLDWKSCGIGPREVDILQVLRLFVPHEKVTPELIGTLLSRYCDSYNIFYPEAKLSVTDLKKSTASMAELLLLCSRPAERTFVTTLPDGSVPDHATWWLLFAPPDAKSARKGESHCKFLTNIVQVLQTESAEAESFERALAAARMVAALP